MRNDNKDIVKLFFTCFVVLMPIMNSYTIPIGKEFGLSLPQLLFPFIAIVILLTRKRICFAIPKKFLYFGIYISIVNLVTSPTFSVFKLVPLSVIGFLFAIGLCLTYVDIKTFLKVYKWSVSIAICFFVFQELIYSLTGYRPDGLLRGIPLMANSIMGDDAYIDSLQSAYRSSSFFLEPSHFAEYITPLLGIELFRGKRIGLYPVLITITLLFLRSGNGIIMLLALWSVWLFLSLKDGKLIKKTAIILVFIPLFFYAGKQYLASETGSIIAERSQNLNDGRSSYMRIIRGYLVYADMPLSQKILGTSDDNIPSIIKNSSVAYTFGDGESYFNAVQTVLITGGIIGFILYFIWLFSVFSKNLIPGKITLILLLLLSLTSSIYLSVSMVFYMTLAYKFQRISLDGTEPEERGIPNRILTIKFI